MPAAPTDSELLETARAAYAEALAGRAFTWGGRKFEAQSIDVLERAIDRLEARAARSTRRPIAVGF